MGLRVCPSRANDLLFYSPLPLHQKLLEKGILRGKGGEGDNTILDLGEDAIRVLVTLDRAGVYGE